MSITVRRFIRALKAIMPAWMLPAFAVCLLIPGPFDEIALLLTAVTLIALQPMRLLRAASAWRGGKSHRGMVVGTATLDRAYIQYAGITSGAWA